MKKKAAVLLTAAALLLTGIAVWYAAPMDLMDLDPGAVGEIAVFNGNSGNVTHITGKEHIQHIIENLNGVEVKRTKLSAGHSGYSFRLTVYLSDGSEAEGWNNFVIDSEETVRKDPFFYSVTNGRIDYGYIEDIVQ